MRSRRWRSGLRPATATIATWVDGAVRRLPMADRPGSWSGVRCTAADQGTLGTAARPAGRSSAAAAVVAPAGSLSTRGSSRFHWCEGGGHRDGDTPRLFIFASRCRRVIRLLLVVLPWGHDVRWLAVVLLRRDIVPLLIVLLRRRGRWRSCRTSRRSRARRRRRPWRS